jgi:hypothetical protein
MVQKTVLPPTLQTDVDEDQWVEFHTGHFNFILTLVDTTHEVVTVEAKVSSSVIR